MNHINYKPNVLQQIKDAHMSTVLITDLEISQTDIDARIKYYKSIPQPKQKSVEWLHQRTNYITASAFNDSISKKWSSRRNELLKDKISQGAYKPFTGNTATKHGEKYEDVACAIYEYRQGVVVEEFGMIAHPKYRYLGASTDGISSKLINLEIKCPYSRIIKPGKIKREYLSQIQLQLDVLDLPLCHFLECKFAEAKSERDFWIDFNYPGQAHKEKGIIFEVIDTDKKLNDNNGKMTYIYSPVNLCENELDMKIWQKQTINRILTSPNLTYIRQHFWTLSIYSCINVARDKDWFQAQIPKAADFWSDVEFYRVNGGMEALVTDINQNKLSSDDEKGGDNDTDSDTTTPAVNTNDNPLVSSDDEKG